IRQGRLNQPGNAQILSLGRVYDEFISAFNQDLPIQIPGRFKDNFEQFSENISQRAIQIRQTEGEGNTEIIANAISEVKEISKSSDDSDVENRYPYLE